MKRKDGQGRVAAMEVLVVTSAIANNIRDKKTFQIPSLMQIGAKVGMMCLNDALLKPVIENIVTPEEALSKAVDREDLRQKLIIAGVIDEPVPVGKKGR